jgi:hypothetical protein
LNRRENYPTTFAIVKHKLKRFKPQRTGGNTPPSTTRGGAPLIAAMVNTLAAAQPSVHDRRWNPALPADAKPTPGHVILGLMARYSPIDAGVSLQASRSDLAALHWEINGIAADFFFPDDASHLLRVSFDRSCIIRVLDEMPLSTEEEYTPNEGLVPGHFAYSIEGAVFARLQSWAWMEVNAPVKHYRFITGWTCLDVLTSAAPAFATVQR